MALAASFRTGKYQNLWGQAAIVRSIRDRIHRLPDQKVTLTHLPAQICAHTFWYSLEDGKHQNPWGQMARPSSV